MLANHCSFHAANAGEISNTTEEHDVGGDGYLCCQFDRRSVFHNGMVFDGPLQQLRVLTKQQPAQLIISQGVLYGTGSGMLFAPCLSFMAEWFEERKSLAYGIM